MSRDVTYLCPFTGPIKGNMYLTNFKLYFASKDRTYTLGVPLGVVSQIKMQPVISSLIIIMQINYMSV